MPKKEHRFPFKDLNAKNGEIYAQLFENPTMGIARGLFWAININFMPLDYDGDVLNPALSCDWIVCDIKNWRNLPSLTLDTIQTMDASFYVVTHDPATPKKLQIEHKQDNIFKVTLHLNVSFSGYFGNDSIPSAPVLATVEIPFTGIIVVKKNLFPLANTMKTLQDIASPFINLAHYGQPIDEEWRFVIPPNVNPIPDEAHLAKLYPLPKGWSYISHTDRPHYREELRKELSNQHPLAKKHLIPLAEEDTSTKVLFVLDSFTSEKLVIVNLTWSGIQEDNRDTPEYKFLDTIAALHHFASF